MEVKNAINESHDLTAHSGLVTTPRFSKLYPWAILAGCETKREAYKNVQTSDWVDWYAYSKYSVDPVKQA